MVAQRFDIWLITLDPTVGHEMQKTRACVIISPDEINLYLGVVIAAPLTSSFKSFPFRLNTFLKKKKGQIALDQMRTFDKSRLVKKLGALPATEAEALCDILVNMFSFK